MTLGHFVHHNATNVSISNGTDYADEELDAIEQVILGSIFLVVCVFICAGNLLTILAVWRTPALRTVPNMYVVSLAVADLLTGCTIPYYSISFFPSISHILDLSKYLCLFRYVIFHICVAESLACLVIISFDRVIYIKCPLRYKTLTSHNKAGVIIAVSWIISIIIGSVILWDNGWTENGSHDSFAILTKNFRIYGLVPGFYTICLITAICYGYIVWKALKHQKAAMQRRMSQLSGSANPVVRSRNNWKSVKVFLLVYGVFFVCWCPNFTLIIVGYAVHIHPSLVYFTVVLGFLNSGMNCVIYAWQNQHFRNAFKTLLCGKQRKRSPFPRGTMNNNHYDSHKTDNYI